MDEQEAKRVRGRGHVKFEMVQTHDDLAFLPNEDDEWTQHRAKAVMEPLRACRMLRQLQNLSRKRKSMTQWTKEMLSLWKAIRRRHAGLFEADFIQDLDRQPYHAKMHFRVEREVARVKKPYIRIKGT